MSETQAKVIFLCLPDELPDCRFKIHAQIPYRIRGFCQNEKKSKFLKIIVDRYNRPCFTALVADNNSDNHHDENSY